MFPFNKSELSINRKIRLIDLSNNLGLFKSKYLFNIYRIYIIRIFQLN